MGHPSWLVEPTGLAARVYWLENFHRDIFCAAVGELIADKLPNIPKRTARAPLSARIITGGLCGACLCAGAGKSLLAGALLGGAGGVGGAFLGYEIRKRLVNNLYIKDCVVAVCEDLLAIALAFFIVSR